MRHRWQNIRSNRYRGARNTGVSRSNFDPFFDTARFVSTSANLCNCDIAYRFSEAQSSVNACALGPVSILNLVIEKSIFD